MFVHSLSALNLVLNNFAGLIRSFQLDFGAMSIDQGISLIEYINNSFILHFERNLKLSFVNCKENVLYELRNPFLNVQSVYFSVEILGIIELDKDMRFNKLFPSLRVLEIGRTLPSDWIFLNGHFQYLYKLELHEQLLDVGKQVLCFLDMNKQIHTLALHLIYPHLLKEISEIQGNLTTLEIYLSATFPLQSNTISGDKIHFFKVTELKISFDLDEIPNYFTFHHLEKLHLDFHSESSEWIDFISNQINSNLSKFSMKTENISRDHLLIIPDKLSSLKEIVIELWSNLTVQDITDFLNKNQHLNKLQIFAYIQSSEYEVLEKSLAENWHLNITDLFRSEIQISRYITASPLNQKMTLIWSLCSYLHVPMKRVMRKKA